MRPAAFSNRAALTPPQVMAAVPATSANAIAPGTRWVVPVPRCVIWAQMAAVAAGHGPRQRPQLVQPAPWLLGKPTAPSISKRGQTPAVRPSRGSTASAGNISTTDSRSAFKLGHSGAVNLGAATAVYLLPQQFPGIVVLRTASDSRARKPSPSPSIDLATLGQPRLDYFP